MHGISVVLPYLGRDAFERTRKQLLQSPQIRKIYVVHNGDIEPLLPECVVLKASSLQEGHLWNRIVGKVRTECLLLIEDPAGIEWGPGAIERLADAATTGGAGMVYSDYCEMAPGRRRERPVNDYQSGSIRDDFHFGPLRLISVPAARAALRKYGKIPEFSHAGFYDLRLKLSMDHRFRHLPAFLYTRMTDPEAGLSGRRRGGKRGRQGENPDSDARLFAYVDPRHQAAQQEMETAATAHLKRISAWLPPDFEAVPRTRMRFPVEASVIIPVRNRRAVIADAVRSALSQQTDFPFNVIVVDNHSTDGTTVVLSRLARKHDVLKHLIPMRTDLGIGGCWNEAANTDCCGRYAVQLDSDDLYSGPGVLQQIVDKLREGPFAMVVGAYTLVNERLEEIPPGLIDHREWTDDNGRNNALRINGLGAPRAFQTALLRKTGFLNVSYGEDYAMALRLTRQYRLGRIYESLYLCRRWENNTDAGLSMEQINGHDAFKDKIRTLEIMARQSLNQKKSQGQIEGTA